MSTVDYPRPVAGSPKQGRSKLKHLKCVLIPDDLSEVTVLLSDLVGPSSLLAYEVVNVCLLHL